MLVLHVTHDRRRQGFKSIDAFRFQIQQFVLRSLRACLCMSTCLCRLLMEFTSFFLNHRRISINFQAHQLLTNFEEPLKVILCSRCSIYQGEFGSPLSSHLLPIFSPFFFKCVRSTFVDIYCGKPR